MDIASPTKISGAEFVIGKFGGLTGTAKAIGKPVTTVQGWKDRGQIPQAHWDDIIAAGAERGIAIELRDFLQQHDVEQTGAAEPERLAS